MATITHLPHAHSLGTASPARATSARQACVPVLQLFTIRAIRLNNRCARTRLPSSFSLHVLIYMPLICVMQFLHGKRAVDAASASNFCGEDGLYGSRGSAPRCAPGPMGNNIEGGSFCVCLERWASETRLKGATVGDREEVSRRVMPLATRCSPRDIHARAHLRFGLRRRGKRLASLRGSMKLNARVVRPSLCCGAGAGLMIWEKELGIFENGCYRVKHYLWWLRKLFGSDMA